MSDTNTTRQGGRGFSWFTIGGAVVLNGIATVVAMAEAALKLYRQTGVAVSRAGTFARAPREAVQEFLTGW